MSQLITTSPKLLADNFCGHCGGNVEVKDNFCRKCGTEVHQLQELVPVTVLNHGDDSQTSLSTNLNPANSASNTLRTILNNRIYVCMVIALIGPLGLPALWFSPRFSQRSKFISTAVYVVLTTIVPLFVVWYFLDYSLRPLAEAFGR